MHREDRNSHSGADEGAPSGLAPLPVLWRGVTTARRRVTFGDEEAILAAEAPSFARCALSVRRQSGAARRSVRSLLSPLGYGDWPLPRRLGVAPEWPRGLVGSMSHCDDFAIAALANAASFDGLGVDIEPARPLPAEIHEIVATAKERREVRLDLVHGRILFCAKEATYKAVHPIDGRFLEMRDIEVDLAAKSAVTSYGRRVTLAFHVDETIVVLALVGAADV